MVKHFIALIALGCLSSPALGQPKGCGPPSEIGDGWNIATPASVGLDSVALCGIDDIVSGWPQANVHSVVVVRHGKLVAERYYSGPDVRFNSVFPTRVQFTPSTKHDLRSISKSVTSLLVGIARGEDRFPPLDAAVLDTFPQYADLRTDEKLRITFRHLLTMSSGLAWVESSRPYSDPANSWNRWRVALDSTRYVLEQPVVATSGKVFNYSSGDTEVLGAALAKVTGRQVDEYAKEKLFHPLGITDFEWLSVPGSWQPAASAGLRLRPRDTAKLGQLMLDDGLWHDERVLPVGWGAESLRPRINGSGLYQYGYQWWLGRSYVGHREVDWIAGRGFGGQRLYIVPTLNLIVMVASGLYDQGPYGPLQEKVPLEILSWVLASAKG